LLGKKKSIKKKGFVDGNIVVMFREEVGKKKEGGILFIRG